MVAAGVLCRGMPVTAVVMTGVRVAGPVGLPVTSRMTVGVAVPVASTEMVSEAVEPHGGESGTTEHETEAVEVHTRTVG
jgi:hypothetical protein